jgi:choice-of-anchor A domain-containing protein
MPIARVALLLSLTIAAYTQASPLDLGIANGYSGFFFADVNAAANVEGRLAIGGNLNAGFDVGYRNAHNSKAPSLVVAGDVSLTSALGKAGIVSNGPKNQIDTNQSIGLGPAIWISKGPNSPTGMEMGELVYGGKLNAAGWQYGIATQNASFLDFKKAKAQLSNLSKQLASKSAIGQWSNRNGSVQLSGDGKADLQVFNLGHTTFKNVSLHNIKQGAHIVINSTLSSVDFQADSTDAMATHRDRIIWNLSEAKSVNISSFLNGSVLAVNADVTGSGHLEGTLIASSLSQGSLELGYEPFQAMITVVPEPASYAFIAMGLIAVFIMRQRKASMLPV